MASPTNYFTLGPDGLPKFGMAWDGVIPAGATAISRTVMGVWSQNPNLRPVTFAQPDGSTVIYVVSPQPQISDAQLVGLLTQAEYAIGLVVGVKAAASATGPMGAAILGGVFNGIAFHGGDLSSQATFDWFITLVAEGVIDPSRLAYILAGLPPDASAPPPPFLAAQAAAASTASSSTAPTSSATVTSGGGTSPAPAPTSSGASTSSGSPSTSSGSTVTSGGTATPTSGGTVSSGGTTSGAASSGSTTSSGATVTSGGTVSSGGTTS